MTTRTTPRTLAWLVALAVLAMAAAAFAAPTGEPRPEGDDEEPRKDAPLRPRPPTRGPDVPPDGPAGVPAEKEEVAADPLADVKAVVRAAFKACLEPSESRAFNTYVDLVHDDQKDTGHAVDQIRRYSWKKFRGGCYQWLKDKKRLEFVIARTDPRKVTKETDRVKIFFKAQQKPKGGGPLRWDAPMELKKDGSRWFIWRNSL